jgi:hypothetical protein
MKHTIEGEYYPCERGSGKDAFLKKYSCTFDAPPPPVPLHDNDTQQETDRKTHDHIAHEHYTTKGPVSYFKHFAPELMKEDYPDFVSLNTHNLVDEANKPKNVYVGELAKDGNEEDATQGEQLNV